MLAPLMLHCQADLPQAYQALQSAIPADAGGSTADEVIQAAILAELSTDYLGLVLHLVGGALPLGSPATVGECTGLLLSESRCLTASCCDDDGWKLRCWYRCMGCMDKRWDFVDSAIVVELVHA